MPFSKLNRFGGVNRRVRNFCVVHVSLEVCVLSAVLPDLDEIPVRVEQEPDLRETQERLFVPLIELSCAYRSTPAVLIRSFKTSGAMQDTQAAP